MKELRFKLVDRDARIPCIQAVRGRVEASTQTVHVPDGVLWQMWQMTGPTGDLREVVALVTADPRPPLLEVRVLERAPRRVTYAAKWARPGPGDPATPEKLFGTLAWAEMPVQVSVHDGEVHVRAIHEDCDRLTDLFDAVRTEFGGLFEATLLRAGDIGADDGSAGAQATLSGDRAAVLEHALAMGYYEQPKRCGLRDLADAIGISKSGAARHLREIEREAVLLLLESAGTEPRRVHASAAEEPG